MGTPLADWVQTAISGGFIAAMIVLVRIALGSERRRADDWRTAAQTTAEANRVMSANVDKLVGTVEQMAATQREMMGTQRELVAAQKELALAQQGMMALLERGLDRRRSSA